MTSLGLLFLMLGLWRSWLGGGIGKDFPPKFLTGTQYIALLGLVMAASWPNWRVGGVNALGLLLLARGYIHGPMLRYPLGYNPKDTILYLVGGPGGGTSRYLAYATIRYVGFSLPWAVALYFLDAVWWAPIAGAWLIVSTYFLFTRLVDAGVHLPTFTTPGDEAANWSELVGWTLMGFALYAAT